MEFFFIYFEYYEEMGIKFFKGVIFYGLFGIGKILLVKVVVN